MQGKYIIMPDSNVSAGALVRLYHLITGEYIDASRPVALRGRRDAPDVPLYPIYSPNDDSREEMPLYEQWAVRIAQLRGTDQLWNPGGDKVPEYLLRGEPYVF